MRRPCLPDLSLRVTGVIALAIAAVCVAFGVLARASLTDYNAHPEEVESLTLCRAARVGPGAVP